MRKSMIVAAAAALLAVSSLPAMAEQVTVTGSITAIDVTDGTITLDNGVTYSLPNDLAVLDSYAPGNMVQITYDDTDPNRKVTLVESAS